MSDYNNIDILYYNNYETLKNNPPKADYYIAGSDQIWRPSSCHPVFFLDFVEDKTKRVSYAASMGNTKIPDNKRQIFSDFVNSFQHISVREQDNAEAIATVSDKNVSVNIEDVQIISLVPLLYCSFLQCSVLAKLRCLIQHPLGVPVDPEVKMI